jgi:hypothetical protein
MYLHRSGLGPGLRWGGGAARRHDHDRDGELDRDWLSGRVLRCLGLVDNSGKAQLGLRVADLQTTAPPALSQGIVALSLAGAVALPNPACGLSGGGTFSWLLRFDLSAGTLTTGGAKPASDPEAGYSFVDEVLGGTPISPVALDLQLAADGSFSTPGGAYLRMPVFLDNSASQYVILPFHDLRVSGKLSAAHDCIGSVGGLPPDGMCEGEAPTYYVPGGSFQGLISLEDADAIPVMALNATLCVLFANNTGVPGPNKYKVCPRDANGKIAFQGDGCTTGSGCGDAVTYHADFVASSVEIH